MTKENGRAPTNIDARSASMPPAISNIAITSVRPAPHRMICWPPFWLESPPEFMVFIINTAESTDVTRYVSSSTTTRTIASCNAAPLSSTSNVAYS